MTPIVRGLLAVAIAGAVVGAILLFQRGTAEPPVALVPAPEPPVAAPASENAGSGDAAVAESEGPADGADADFGLT